MPKEVTALKLQARKDEKSEWGTLNTIQLEQVGSDKAYSQAKATLEELAMRWHQAYDPNWALRIVDVT
jgi:hypothetical protein